MASTVDRVAQLLAPGAARQRHSFRAGLRSARAQVQADAEGFEAIVVEIERLGRHLEPKGTGLGQYTASLVKLVKRGCNGTKAEVFSQRLFLLKETRNDSAHQGAHARQAALEAMDAALVLEEALCRSWESLAAKHVMVTNPVVAERWHTLGEVRQQMLRHALSSIPIEHGGRWYLLQDTWLARWVAGAGGVGRQAAYRMRVEDVVEQLGAPLKTIDASLELGGVDLTTLERGLVLVHDDRHNDRPLVGVIAASDLL